MGFSTAIRTCLSNYVTFSGRARRPEYWWFLLFVSLLILVFSFIDAAVFGPNPEIGEPRRILASVVQLATFLPLLAVGWRRMHDSGRPGWYLLLPMVVSSAFMLLMLTGVLAFAGLEQVTSDSDAVSGAALALGLTGVLVAVVVQLVLAVLIIWWLTRPSDPAANMYGEPVT